MEEKKKFETYQMLPRLYGTSPTYRTVVSAPTRYAIGAFLITPEREKLQMLKEWLDYYSKGLLLPSLVSIKFHSRVTDHAAEKISHLLSSSPEELGEALKQEIVKEKGTQKLWKVSEPIIGGRLEHRVLTGKVKSRRSGIRKGVLSEWSVVDDSPYYREGYGVDHNHLGCQCDDFLWDETKRAVVECAHICGLKDRACKEYPGREGGMIEFKKPHDIPWIPYILNPVSIIDVLVLHYFLGMRYYDIDKQISKNPDIYDPFHLESIEKGNVVFEVVPQVQSRERTISEGDAKSLEHVWNRTEETLRRGGFKRMGSATVEFKDTIWETVCPHYEKDGRVVRLLFSDPYKHPPLLEYREKSAEDPIEIFYKPEDVNPFNRIYEEQRSVDDRTRRRTKTKIMIPHSPKSIDELPELQEIRRPIIVNFRRQYAELIRQHFQGDTDQLLGELGLIFS